MKLMGWKVLVSLWTVILLSLPLSAVTFEHNGQFKEAVTPNRLMHTGDESPALTMLDGPEVEDRIRDVKLFGLVRFAPQFALAHVDVVSAGFSEQSGDREFLFLDLELRNLKEQTYVFEAVYAVAWRFNTVDYATVVHVRPGGVQAFLVGRSTDWDDDIEDWDLCEGLMDIESNTLTWIIPKDAVGGPQPADVLQYISPHTHLRFTTESGLPRGDIFKDLSHNAKLTNDYVIQF